MMKPKKKIQPASMMQRKIAREQAAAIKYQDTKTIESLFTVKADLADMGMMTRYSFCTTGINVRFVRIEDNRIVAHWYPRNDEKLYIISREGKWLWKGANKSLGDIMNMFTLAMYRTEPERDIAEELGFTSSAPQQIAAPPHI